MSRTAMFFNFTKKPFTGYWNGKPKTFNPGEKKFMPEYLARHFAKHLTNQVLIDAGKETSTSPKFPEQVPEFMEVFNKAFTCDEEDEKPAIDVEIDMANSKEPAKPVTAQKAVAAPKNRNSNKALQIVLPPADDEDEDEAKNFAGKK